MAVLSLLFLGVHIAPGSYCYAEMYEFDANEPELITAIENLKKDNPRANVPISDLPDGRSDSDDYWYHVYFYYPDEKQIVYFWTRPAEESGKTNIGFVGVNEGLTLGNWKRVNENFSRKENRDVKRNFEQRILDRLGLKYKDNGNGMKIGFVQF